MQLIAIAQLKPGRKRMDEEPKDYQFSTFYNNGSQKAYRISPTENSSTGFPVNAISDRIKQNGCWLFSLEILYE